jgi:hypothetical protein
MKPERKSGAEPFVNGRREASVTLADFWRWAFSDVLSNATRGALAEFIVASALGPARGVRGEWDSYDLVTDSGKTIEVKSAAYLQSWRQKRLSKIAFSVRAARAWDADSDEFAGDSRRQADVYVFCLLAHTDKATVNPLDLGQWRFYVIATRALNDKLPGAKTISLKRLLSLSPAEGAYRDLRALVARAGR